MSIIFPYRWNGQFPSETKSYAMTLAVAKSRWEQALADLTDKQIEKGLSACEKSGKEFPPSIPEFRKMCLPTMWELGILPIEEAYEQFCAKDHSHSLVEDIYLKIGSWNFKTLSSVELRKRFNTCYQMVCDKYLMESKEGRQFLESRPQMYFLEDNSGNLEN